MNVKKECWHLQHKQLTLNKKQNEPLFQRKADSGAAGQTLPATVVEPWFSRVVSIYILPSKLITVTAGGYFFNIG